LRDNSKVFAIRLLLVLVGIIALVVIGRKIMLPKSWGEYGYYRGDYINEEANRNMKYGTNDTCKSCHEEVYQLKAHSVHKNLSCEMCHAPIVEHVKEGKKIAKMPSVQNKEQIALCLSCHQEGIGRPKNFPLIDHQKHLRDQKVKPTHSCDQCHTVHDPMENITHARKITTLKEVVDER
jgi:nitrate/TMAO reductase-like tetraheme cytochrome c subunit